MNVLISGAGIAGPTLAFWLRKYGFAPTVVESAPALRTSGYVIDFWGIGYDIAEKMGRFCQKLCQRGIVANSTWSSGSGAKCAARLVAQGPSVNGPSGRCKAIAGSAASAASS